MARSVCWPRARWRRGSTFVIGDTIRLGEHAFQLRGIIEREPDRLSSGFGFGPRAMISSEGLAASELVQPGQPGGMGIHARLP
jgi:putative ABC transport system permease protein